VAALAQARVAGEKNPMLAARRFARN
jgi:hypothetical protein